MFLSTCVIERRVVPTVEQWSPKPKVKGSNPFSPVSKTHQKCFFLFPETLFEELFLRAAYNLRKAYWISNPSAPLDF